MTVNLWSLYAFILKGSLFEEAIAKLWHNGLISGELRLGTGEETIIAGVVTHLRESDAMASDHRGTGYAPRWALASCPCLSRGDRESTIYR